eukprot:3849045-Rhodomonas_salina.1
MSTQTEHDFHVQKRLAEWIWKHIQTENTHDTTCDLLVSNAQEKTATNWAIFKETMTASGIKWVDCNIHNISKTRKYLAPCGVNISCITVTQMNI